MIKKNKKAVSLMISYVLLVAIALLLSAGVYVWLKVYVPKNIETCSSDVSLILQNYDCDTLGEIIITVKNNGLFTADGLFIRASEIQGDLPTIALINPNNDGPDEPGRWDFEALKLKPGEIDTKTFNYPSDVSNIEKIQIQPFVIGKEGILLCENIITQPLQNC